MHIFSSIKEAVTSVIPIALIVLILSVTCVPLDAGVLVMFLFGTVLLILGMSFFTVGSGISMEPLGDGIGKSLSKSKKFLFPVAVCFILGFFITVSEPDLQVLAEQVPTIPNMLLIVCVGVGVGIFLCLSFIRNKKELSLRTLLIVFYTLIVGVTIFAPGEFIPTAFDSGGVTTGPITVPFIMALGAGLAEFAELGKSDVEGEREIICILASLSTSAQIMESVNKDFGINSSANGIIIAIPTEKAYKI